MMTTRLAIFALVTAPFAAQAKKHNHIRHHVSTMQSGTYGTSGISTTQSGTYYGTSGTSVGSVVAPSVGSYYWPSVGATNAVPTWSNTGPRVSSAPAPGAPAIGTAPFSSGVRR